MGHSMEAGMCCHWMRHIKNKSVGESRDGWLRVGMGG